MAVLRNVTVQWASVQAPDTQYDPKWTVEALLSEDEADALVAESKKYHEKGITIKNKDGQLSYRFERKVDRADGNGENKAPAVKSTDPGPDGKPQDFGGLIGNGSTCNINYSFFKWDNKYGSGVKSDFKGIQVVDLVEYGRPDGDEFEAEDNDTGSTSPAAAGAANDTYDDDDFS